MRRYKEPNCKRLNLEYFKRMNLKSGEDLIFSEIIDLEKVSVGSIFDAQDYFGNWYLSIAVDKPKAKELMVHFLPFAKNPKRDELFLIPESNSRCAGAFTKSERPKDPINAIDSLRSYLEKFNCNSLNLPKLCPMSPFPIEIEAILEDTPAVVECLKTFAGPNPFTSILNNTTQFQQMIDHSIKVNGMQDLSMIELLEVSYKNRPELSDQE